MLGAILLVFSCDDKLDVQQVYLFTVTTMPVQKRIKIGETAEIRCQLHWEGYYEETKYFIRYFQPDGKGTLRMADETVFLPTLIPQHYYKIFFLST